MTSHDTDPLRAGGRPMFGVAALIGAMLADFAETAIDPANSDKAAKLYAASAQHHGRMVVSAALLLASALLLAPGVLGIARALPSRGRSLGLGAGGLALLGAAGHAALATFYVVFATIQSSSLSAARGVALIDHITTSHEALLLAPLAIAFPLAILLTLIATVRSGLVGRRLLLPVVAAPVVAIAAPASDAVKTCGALVLFLVAAAVVLRAVATRPAAPAAA